MPNNIIDICVSAELENLKSAIAISQIGFAKYGISPERISEPRQDDRNPNRYRVWIKYCRNTKDIERDDCDAD